MSADWMRLLTHAHEAMSAAANSPRPASELVRRAWRLAAEEFRHPCETRRVLRAKCEKRFDSKAVRRNLSLFGLPVNRHTREEMPNSDRNREHYVTAVATAIAPKFQTIIQKNGTTLDKSREKCKAERVAKHQARSVSSSRPAHRVRSLTKPSVTQSQLLFAARRGCIYSVQRRNNAADVNERKVIETANARIRFMLPSRDSSEGRDIILALRSRLLPLTINRTEGCTNHDVIEASEVVRRVTIAKLFIRR